MYFSFILFFPVHKQHFRIVVYNYSAVIFFCQEKHNIKRTQSSPPNRSTALYLNDVMIILQTDLAVLSLCHLFQAQLLPFQQTKKDRRSAALKLLPGLFLL